MKKLGVEEYLKELYLRLSQAQVVPKKSVKIGGWEPAHSFCHDNVDKFCAQKKGYKRIYGWLYSDVSELGYVSFIFHSVVQGPDGELFDITPTDSVFKYPFLTSNISDEAYLELMSLHNGAPKIDLSL